MSAAVAEKSRSATRYVEMFLDEKQPKVCLSRYKYYIHRER